MRLDKLLAHSGYGTRKDVKKLIASGQVQVNGISVKKAGLIVDPDQDSVVAAGQPVDYQEYYYVMLNKPAGLLSATHDPVYETVIDWVELDYHHVDLFPVGRLDMDTTGLLLLTNNGQLAHRLTSPNHEVAKLYYALIEGRIDEEAVARFAEGIDLADFVTKPAHLQEVEYYPDTDQSIVEVEIMEGKYHQVKRMIATVGSQVIQLHRQAMGPLVLDDDLAEGEWRELNEAERLLLEPYGLI